MPATAPMRYSISSAESEVIFGQRRRSHRRVPVSEGSLRRPISGGRLHQRGAGTQPVAAYRLPVPPCGTDFRRTRCSSITSSASFARNCARRSIMPSCSASGAPTRGSRPSLQMLEQLEAASGGASSEIYVPMDRSDIGEYVGLSLAAVSRTFGSLVQRNVIKFRDRRHVRVINRAAFDRIVAGGNVRRVSRKARGR